MDRWKLKCCSWVTILKRAFICYCPPLKSPNPSSSSFSLLYCITRPALSLKLDSSTLLLCRVMTPSHNHSRQIYVVYFTRSLFGKISVSHPTLTSSFPSFIPVEGLTMEVLLYLLPTRFVTPRKINGRSLLGVIVDILFGKYIFSSSVQVYFWESSLSVERETLLSQIK